MAQRPLVIGRLVTNHICPRRYVTKGAGTNIIWTICHNCFSTWTIYHIILDDLSQVINFVTFFWLLDDLSQITFVLDDMSQKGAICTKIIWKICQKNVVLGQFVTLLFWTICHKSYLSQFYFGRFVTSHSCHNFILDDLSQVIFVL